MRRQLALLCAAAMILSLSYPPIPQIEPKREDKWQRTWTEIKP